MRRRLAALAVLGAMLTWALTLSAGASVPRVLFAEDFGYPG